MKKKTRSISNSRSSSIAEKKLSLYDDRFAGKNTLSVLDSNGDEMFENQPKKNKNNSNLKLPHIALMEPIKSPTNLSLSLIEEPEETFNRALNRLEAIWTQKQIPSEITETFKSFLLSIPRQKSVNIINSEINLLKNNCSTVQAVLKSINNREESLESIHELNSYLESTDWLSLKEVHLQCAELLHGHRLFTITVIESIGKWRETLMSSLIVNNSNMKFIEFKWKEQNYVLKLKSDLDFLKSSQFAKILDFGENDPLLIRPSVPSGKEKRGRKRDPNYFIDGGQVIVPIPSFLMERVKNSEEEIRKEYEYLKFLEDNTPKKQAEIFSPSIVDDLIEENICKLLMEIETEVSEQKKEAKRKKKQDRASAKHIDNISQAIINSVIDKELNDLALSIVKDSKEMQKAIMLEDLSQKIAEGLMLQLITDVNLSELCNTEYFDYKTESEYKGRVEKEQRDQENIKLSKDIQVSFLEPFLILIVTEIAKESIKEHRKQQDEENKIYIIRSPLMEEIGLDFASSEYFSDMSGLKWIPLKLSEELMSNVLTEYYSALPNINSTIMPDIEELMIEVTKNQDTCWYWAVKGTLIFGFLVYSVDCYNKSGRKLIVHHISSLLWKSYGTILESATQHLWDIDSCEEIRVNIFNTKGIDLTPEVKKIFTQQGYKWKTKLVIKNSSHEITVLGKHRKNTGKTHAQPNISFKLAASVVISTTHTPNYNLNLAPEMAQVGNRPSMLNSLLGLFGDIENAHLKITSIVKTKLQGVLNSLFNLMNETNSFSFPYMTTASSPDKLPGFLSNNNIDTPSILGKASASLLDIHCRWISCTNYIQEIRGQNYRFMRFRSSDIKCDILENEFEVYYVATELPDVRAFFIASRDMFENISKEVQNSQLDMYSVSEKMLLREGNEEVQEIWMPCFRKYVKWQVPWVEGYEIPSQTGGSSIFVDKCYEEVRIEMDLLPIPEGLLQINNRYGPVLMNDFVFGLMYTKGDKILEIPLFACIVRESDWIKS